ncbi:MAG: nucleotide pyrophosphohydrolase [Firmicutes bacterium HGW-Firmicutes-7]|nr:MAG: nucleotide pyrophosphohydrolase [Firmicutes bacterium HGW-Firmicutes-7]
MDEILQSILKFRDERNWKQFHTPEKLAISINLEAAELLENFQWDNNYDLENMSDELGDVFLYCLLMADSIGIDLKEATLKKIEKNREKYPVDKAKGTSKKYTQL